MTPIEFRIQDYSKEVLSAFEEQVKTALDSIGATVAGYAVKNAPVDTGLLRNSIAWAISGEKPQLGELGGGRKKRTYKADKPDSSGEIKSGVYTGHVPSSKGSAPAVYIGTNVEYAAAVEYRDIDHKVGKAHFLRDAATKHGNEYKEIVETALKD